MHTVMGIDSSLTNYAHVLVGAKQKVLDFGEVKTKPPRSLEDRIDEISTEALRFAKRYKPDFIVMEAGARGFKNVDLSIYHLAGVVRWRLWRRGFLVHLVEPTSLKLDLAGKGNASKDDMLAAARTFWPTCPNHNLADAYGCGRLGHRDYRILVEPGD